MLENITLKKTFLFILFFSFSFFALAQESTKLQVISEVTTAGLDKASKNQVFSLIRQLEGQDLIEILIINSIKQLYALGFFEDVSVALAELPNGDARLIFSFVEKKKIQSIIFEGNQKIDNAKLTKSLATKVYNFVDEELIQTDLVSIRKLYIEEGYSRVRVLYRLEDDGQDNLRLIFQVMENDKVYLTKIKIQGSKFFFPLDIERIMQSAEIDCFSWITNSGRLSKEKIDVDLMIITRSYLENGFIDIQIAKPQIKLLIAKDFITAEVTLKIDEGKQYFVGDIFVESLDKDQSLLFTKEEALALMVLKTGSVYNLLQQNQDRIALNNAYQDAGYAFSSVRVKRKLNKQKQIVDLFFQILRQEKVYLNRIEFEGNQETRDDIIRRELTIYDGELFNGKKIRESQAKIRGLGYFLPQAGVRLQRETQRSKNEVNYSFYLKEIQTGNFSGGLSYSDTVGLGVNLSIVKNNFLGTGRRISFQYDRGENIRTTELAFTEPYFLSSLWRSVSSVSVEFSGKNNSNLDYDRNIKSISQSFSYPIWKNWRANFNYSFESVLHSNFNTDASSSTPSSIIRSFTNGYTYSTVNNPFFPSNGQSHNLQFRQTGGLLGGTDNYRRASYEYKYFKNIVANKLIFYYRLRLRKLFQIFDEDIIPVSARFALGGTSSIRGFRSFEIRGPSSPNEWPDSFSEPVAGDQNYEYYFNHRYGAEELLSNIELSFPLSRTGQSFRGLFFYDIGNVFAEDRMYDIVGLKKDYTYLRQSYGTGIRIITPLGVFKFDYGIKANPIKNEFNSLFEFTIGSLF